MIRPRYSSKSGILGAVPGIFPQKREVPAYNQVSSLVVARDWNVAHLRIEPLLRVKNSEARTRNQPTTIPMWPDNETVDDLIGFRVHSDLIADVVSDPKLLPATLGVFGEWGNGKTSIMKMLEAKLGEREDVAVLYFDAWLFEGFDDAKSALISSILKQLIAHKRFPETLKEEAAKLIGRVNWMRVLKMGWDNVALPAILAYATGGATAIPGLLGGIRALFSKTSKKAGDAGGDQGIGSLLMPASKETEITEIRDFRDAFGSLLAKTKLKSLVVLIDDLDRCSPERIVENLEAIKLFLNVGATAFVIGADPRIVRHAIAVRYKDAIEAARVASEGVNPNEAGAQLVRDYLEKLIQIPYHLPRLSPAEIETYMTLLFARRDLDSQAFTSCLKACDERRHNNRFCTFGLADITEAIGDATMPPELRDALSFTAGAAPMLTDNLKGNPRQIKRFLNAFTLRQRLSKVARMESMKDAVLLKLILLEYSADERFKELAAWHQAQNETPKEIREMEVDEKYPDSWDRPGLRRWIEMEPQLRSVDLSDYFWLARDKLASSLLGLTLVPPIVRNTYNALLSEMGRKSSDSVVAALRDDEVDSLFGLLAKHLQRDPESLDGYRAILKFAELRPARISQLTALIKELPAEKIPPSIGPQISLLGRAVPSIRNDILEIQAYLSKQTGRAAKAIQLQKK